MVTIDEEARRRFEAEWQGGGPASIAPYLPRVDDPRRLGTLEELVCIDLELSWKRHGPAAPALEDYLDWYPELLGPEIAGRLGEEAKRIRRTESLGRYAVIAEHGRGGFGVVFRSHDPLLGREVAVKVLSGERARDPSARDRFLFEARTAAGLEHPGIVPVYDLGPEDAATPYYAMKLVRGRTLATAIAEHHAAPDAVSAVRLLRHFADLARAVAYAHSRGVLHRDIKPDNVIVGDHGETVVLDWGLARSSEGGRERSVVGVLIGTPAYMSPEQAVGRVDSIDARTDVYGLGVVLYEVLAGRRPFEGGSTVEVLDRVLRGDFAPPRAVAPAVPRPLEAVCLRAMACDPAARYADVASLVADLERWLADEPVSAYREPLLVRLGRFARRHRTAALAAATGLVVALVAGGIGAVAWERMEARQKRQQARDVARLTAGVRADEAVAAAAMRFGRWGEAVALLDAAIARLVDAGELTRTRARLEELVVRARALERFARQYDQAWFLSGEERDSGAKAAAETALGALGDVQSPGYFDHLPTGDLDAPAREALREDAFRLLLLLAALDAKPAAIGTGDAAAACRAATGVLDVARTHRKTAFDALVRLGCFLVAGEPAPVALQGPPEAAVDAFFFGLVHLWIYAFKDSLPTALATRLIPESAALTLDDPLEASVTWLRQAAELEPRQYWHTFMLGWALRAADDPRAAELAFNTGVALRPEYPRAWEARGAAILDQALALPAGASRDAEIARAVRDFERALVLAPSDPWTYWARGDLFATLGRSADALGAYERAMTLDPAPSEPWSGRQGPGQALAVAEPLTRSQPDDADAWAVVGGARLMLGDLPGAKAAVERALALSPNHAFATELRGRLGPLQAK